MGISRLEVQNFRSLKNVTIDIPQICALVGPNNAGKSNILLSLHKVLGRDWLSVNQFDETDVYGHDPDADVRIALTLTSPAQYRKYKYALPTDICTLEFTYTRYKVGDKKGERRLEQKCLDSNGKLPMVLAEAPKKGRTHTYEPVVGIPSEVRESIPLIYIGTDRSLRDQLPSSRYSLLRQLLEDINRDLHDPAQRLTVTMPDGSKQEVQRAEVFRKYMEHALGLLRTDSFEELESSIRTNALRQLGFDPVEDADKLDFYFAPFDSMDFYKALDLRVREGDFQVSASDMGEGVQNALVLAILQAFEERRKKGAIILIEEPEMFLHPQMQRSLYKTICEIGKTNQVVYTTHSPHFVGIPNYDRVTLVRKGTQGTYLTRSKLPNDQRRREKLLKELDPERNELFFASRLLLVEGDTEKLALPEYAARLELDLDRAGASIVEVGGKRNLLEFAEIASSFGIPTGVLYDEDSSDIPNAEENSKLNRRLAEFGDISAGNAAWGLSAKYEDHLKAALGEQEYQRRCQEHAGTGKPTKARLIAADASTPIPKPIEEVLKWLAGAGETAK